MPFWVITVQHSKTAPSYTRCFWPWVTANFRNVINALDKIAAAAAGSDDGHGPRSGKDHL